MNCKRNIEKMRLKGMDDKSGMESDQIVPKSPCREANFHAGRGSKVDDRPETG